jgi:hypothetical protein
MTCHIESTFPEDKLSISLSPITNEGDGTFGGDSEVTFFITDKISKIWNVAEDFVFRSLWSISENRHFSIPWYGVVLCKCNIFVDNVIMQ